MTCSCSVPRSWAWFVEFVLDDDLRRSIQSELVEMGVFVLPWLLADINVGGWEALLLSNGGWVLGEVVGLRSF